MLIFSKKRGNKITMFKSDTSKWYIERIVWLVAGSVVLAGTILGYFIHKFFFFFPVLAGINMIIFSLTGFCPLAIILDKFGVKSQKEMTQCNI